MTESYALSKDGKRIRVEVLDPPFVRKFGPKASVTDASASSGSNSGSGGQASPKDGEGQGKSETKTSPKETVNQSPPPKDGGGGNSGSGSNKGNSGPDDSRKDLSPVQMVGIGLTVLIALGLTIWLALGGFKKAGSAVEHLPVVGSSNQSTGTAPESEAQEYTPGGTGLRVERSTIGGGSAESHRQALVNQLKAPLVFGGEVVMEEPSSPKPTDKQDSSPASTASETKKQDIAPTENPTPAPKSLE